MGNGLRCRFGVKYTLYLSVETVGVPATVGKIRSEAICYAMTCEGTLQLCRCVGGVQGLIGKHGC